MVKKCWKNCMSCMLKVAPDCMAYPAEPIPRPKDIGASEPGPALRAAIAADRSPDIDAGISEGHSHDNPIFWQWAHSGRVSWHFTFLRLQLRQPFRDLVWPFRGIGFLLCRCGRDTPPVVKMADGRGMWACCSR